MDVLGYSNSYWQEEKRYLILYFPKAFPSKLYYGHLGFFKISFSVLTLQKNIWQIII